MIKTLSVLIHMCEFADTRSSNPVRFISIMISLLVTRPIERVGFAGDIIIKEGTIGTKMYFIQEGIVDIGKYLFFYFTWCS